MQDILNDALSVLALNRWNVVGAISLALISFFAGRRNNRITRRATAASTFRKTVTASIERLSADTRYWSGLPNVCRTIAASTREYSIYVPHFRRRAFCRTWQELKKHCEDEIPGALSDTSAFYQPGRAQAARRRFHADVEKLLSFARDT